MLTRRQLVISAAASFALVGLNGCSSGDDQYDEDVRSIWRHTEGRLIGEAAVMRELVRCASVSALQPQHPMLEISYRKSCNFNIA